MPVFLGYNTEEYNLYFISRFLFMAMTFISVWLTVYLMWAHNKRSSACIKDFTDTSYIVFYLVGE